MRMRGSRPGSSVASVLGLASLINLDTPAHYVHLEFFKMSVANLAVILLMIAVFVAVILLPFPSRERDQT